MTSPRWPCVLGLLAVALPSAAQVTFEIAFDDPAGLYAAYQPDLQRLATLAGSDWTRHFAVPEQPLLLSVEIGFAAIPTANGRSMSSGFLYADESGMKVFEQGAAYELRTGIDPNAAAPDIGFVFGSGGYLQQELWFDPQPMSRSVAVPDWQTDAYSVLLHEFGHAFGFNGWRDASTGTLAGNYLSSFDALVDWQPGADGGSGHFVGAAAMARHGGAVAITRGNYGHLGNGDGDGSAALSGDLMNGLAFERGTRYAISALDLDMLGDMGLPMAAPVPEAGSAWLLALGLGTLVLRRRQRLGAPPAAV